MQHVPKIVYVKHNSGCIPSLVWRRQQDAHIDQKLRLVHDLDAVLDAQHSRRIWLGNVHSLEDTQAIPSDGFAKWICYIGEPNRNFGEFWHHLDRPNTHIVMTGSANFRTTRARIYRTETFFGEMVNLYRNFPDELMDRPTTTKSYYFDALLGTAARPPRSTIAQHLQTAHPGKNLVKLYANKNPYLFRDVIEADYVWPDGVDFTGLEDQPFYAAQMVKYRGLPAMICLIVPWNVYDQTAYSIVAETMVDNTFNFYTEKTAKPIIARRLFLAFAGQYHLRNLHALGFRTFDGIIDESYDLEPDPHKRWSMIRDQIDRLCQQDQMAILEAVRPIAEHNFHTLMSRDWAHETNELLIDIMLGEN